MLGSIKGTQRSSETLDEDIEADGFVDEVKTSLRPVVLEFWVRSCDQCRRFKPVYEELSSILDERATFLRMNMLKSLGNLRLAEGMGVEKTPTTKIFCEGKEAGSIVGFRTLRQALKEVNAVLGSSPCAGP